MEKFSKKTADALAQQAVARDQSYEVQFARLKALADPTILEAIADCIEERNPDYPGAFDFRLMKPLVAPGREIGALNERLTGLVAEQSLGNYVYWGVEFADVTTLGQHALGMVATDDLTSPVEADEDDDLYHVNAGRASVLLGLALTKVLLKHDTKLAYTLLNKAHKLVELVTTLPGVDKREEAASKFARKLQKLTVLLANAFTANQ